MPKPYGKNGFVMIGVAGSLLPQPHCILSLAPVLAPQATTIASEDQIDIFCCMSGSTRISVGGKRQFSGDGVRGERNSRDDRKIIFLVF